MRQVVGKWCAGDVHRPLFDPLKHRSDVIPPPAWQPPAVVVQIAALDPEHGVHCTAAAEHPTARLCDPPTRTAGLRFALVLLLASTSRTLAEDSVASRPATGRTGTNHDEVISRGGFCHAEDYPVAPTSVHRPLRLNPRWPDAYVRVSMPQQLAISLMFSRWMSTACWLA
jgi:hypothetical protein